MHCFLRWVASVLVALACLHLGAVAVIAERRVALVIGNASYGHYSSLPNVPNDAAAMAALFKAAKFDAVEVKRNLGIAELRWALREFSRQAAGADVAVLFFAGHGIEVDRTNYLIPVDARLAADIDVEDETVSLDRVLQLLEPAKRLRLVILDACRENPFAAGMKRTVATRSVGRGLARVEPQSSNTLIAYATKANAVAEDGKGANSPFTAALVKHLTAPGLDLRIALGHVRDEVLAATGNKQEPYFTGSLGGGILSLTGPAQPTGLPQTSAAALEWARVDKSSIAELETFERRHPASVEAEYARARLKELRKVAVVSPPPPPLVTPPKAFEPAVTISPSRAPAPLTAAEERALKPKDGFKECNVCPEMVVVPAGSFMMGSSTDDIAGLKKEHKADDPDAEAPQRRVTIARSFAVGKFEVTFAEWAACVAAGGCAHDPLKGMSGQKPSVGKLPITGVSWNDITTQFLPWLSRKTGKVYRLLTEAEWEYAVRAGTTTRYAFGDTIAPGQAQFSVDNPTTVGEFHPNAFGLHDMHGNVWEWVQDCWNGSYKGAPVDGSAWTTGECDRRVVRGGSYDDHPSRLRSAKRGFAAAGFRHRDDDPWFSVGFRVARSH
jgi:formylglycine-generating enzyme required for sulfatase activity